MQYLALTYARGALSGPLWNPLCLQATESRGDKQTSGTVHPIFPRCLQTELRISLHKYHILRPIRWELNMSWAACTYSRANERDHLPLSRSSTSCVLCFVFCVLCFVSFYFLIFRVFAEVIFINAKIFSMLFDLKIHFGIYKNSFSKNRNKK